MGDRLSEGPVTTVRAVPPLVPPNGAATHLPSTTLVTTNSSFSRNGFARHGGAGAGAPSIKLEPATKLTLPRTETQLMPTQVCSTDAP